MKKSKSVRPPAGYKKLQCKYCEEYCMKVDERADAVTCWRCTIKLADGHRLELRK
jgi:hypothetical protein